MREVVGERGAIVGVRCHSASRSNDTTYATCVVDFEVGDALEVSATRSGGIVEDLELRPAPKAQAKSWLERLF